MNVRIEKDPKGKEVICCQTAKGRRRKGCVRDEPLSAGISGTRKRANAPEDYLSERSIERL